MNSFGHLKMFPTMELHQLIAGLLLWWFCSHSKPFIPYYMYFILLINPVFTAYMYTYMYMYLCSIASS